MNGSEILKRYVEARAAAVPAGESRRLLAHAAAAYAKPGSGGHHLRKLALGLALALAMSAGAVSLELWARTHRISPQPVTSPVPTSALPDEVVEIGAFSNGAAVVAPFRIRDQKLLPVQPGWMVGEKTALIVTEAGIRPDGTCTAAVVRIVNTDTGRDLRPAVTLNRCYLPAATFPNHTVLLAWGDSAAIYDWQAGVVTRSLPQVKSLFGSGEIVVSPDGQLLYTVGFVANEGSFINLIDLNSGALRAHVPFYIESAGPEAFLGHLALSHDGKKLYVDAGYAFAVLDAQTLNQEQILEFPADQASMLPGWLAPSVINGEAKEPGVASSAIALDPSGQWAAMLGPQGGNSGPGVWVVSLQGRARILGHYLRGQNFRGIGVSRDGKVLYLLEDYAYGHDMLAIDSQNGRTLREFHIGLIEPLDPNSKDFYGIAAVVPAGG